ncbi:MAG: hypothetical protein ABSE48_11250 [Verrucomicrobiota bacterium]
MRAAQSLYDRLGGHAGILKLTIDVAQDYVFGSFGLRAQAPEFSGVGIRANSTAGACLRASYQFQPRSGAFWWLLAWPR